VDGKLACEATLTCQVVPRVREARGRLSRSLPLRQGERAGGVSIHPSAVIAAGAVVPESCTVGPFCTIGPDVVLGEDCVLISHVVLDGRTRIGARNTIHPFTRSASRRRI
jgi:UDP-3-O-[3-hydroxymyristoyl] glucosamine N-acyltransferase